jgi:hypothetical protein
VPSSSDADRPLTWLFLEHRRVRSVLSETPAVIAEARALGASWEAVGEALGTTRQAAMQRWEKRLPG